MRRMWKRLAQFRYKGRILYGDAIFFDRTEFVSNNMGPHYCTLRPDCVVENIDSTFPLGLLHPWGGGNKNSPQMPIGSVKFYVQGNSLKFKAQLAKSDLGNDALEQIRLGSLKDVSIGFVSMHPEVHHHEDGLDHVIHTHIKIMELSLVPTGHGAFPNATILKVR